MPSKKAAARQELADALRAFLKPYQFTQQRNIFYRISDDIAYCISIEAPGLLYVHYFIVPLYLPNERIHLSFGNRLKNNSSSSQGSQFWIESVLEEIEARVFPFFERSSTKDHLLLFLQESDAEIVKHFFSPPPYRHLLKAYTALYLSRTSVFRQALLSAKEEIKKSAYFTQPVRDKLMDDLKRLEMLSSCPAEDVSAFFERNIQQSVRACFPTQSAKKKSIEKTEM